MDILEFFVIAGVDEANTTATHSLEEQLNDKERIDYYHDYLQQLLLAIRYIKSPYTYTYIKEPFSFSFFSSLQTTKFSTPSS